MGTETEILALAQYLDTDSENIEKIDDHRYYDADGSEYYVFLDENLVIYINEELYPEQCDLASDELNSSTRYSEYHKFYTIDYDEMYEHCIINLEQVLGTSERESIELGNETYIILELL
jgi:hypothetical protein